MAKKELDEKNCIVIPGKVPTACFEEKLYGMHTE